MKNNSNKILVVNDEKTDIKYTHSSIDNQFYHEKVSLADLNQIFGTNPNDIFLYDTSESISFILSDNSEISLHQYTPNIIDKIRFLKITNEALKKADGEIIIAVNQWHYNSLEGLMISDCAKNLSKLINYAGNYQTITDHAYADLNGYANTQEILSNLDYAKHEISPAIQYAIHQQIIQNDRKYQGYLPSIGQLNIIFKITNLVNYIFKEINSTEFISIDTFNWSCWSSTQYEPSFFWKLSSTNAFIKNNIIIGIETEKNKVCPLFKKL